VNTLLESLPHKGAAVLIDRVLEINGRQATALKTFPEGDRAFDGHFPSQPVVPGVIVVDALAQLSGLISFTGVAYLAMIWRMKFLRPIQPNEQIVLVSTQTTRLGSAAQFLVEARVNGELAVSGTIALAGRVPAST